MPLSFTQRFEPPAASSQHHWLAKICSFVSSSSCTLETSWATSVDSAVGGGTVGRRIRWLYTLLNEQKDIELGVVKDGKNKDQPVQDPSATMCFRSLRRSIHGDLRWLSTPAFEKGTKSISTNALLSYMRMHPSGRFIPWDVWAPGNVHMVLRQEVMYETITRMHSLCGMCTPSDHIMFHK